jgi:hypothetical protein
MTRLIALWKSWMWGNREVIFFMIVIFMASMLTNYLCAVLPQTVTGILASATPLALAGLTWQLHIRIRNLERCLSKTNNDMWRMTDAIIKDLERLADAHNHVSCLVLDSSEEKKEGK